MAASWFLTCSVKANTRAETTESRSQDSLPTTRCTFSKLVSRGCRGNQTEKERERARRAGQVKSVWRFAGRQVTCGGEFPVHLS